MFPAGTVIERREVLHGRVWSVLPMTVVADSGALLALSMAEGTPLRFPDHPFGPHPWSYTDRWRASDVLHLHRPDDGYSVWAFHRHGERVGGWYVNFQRPLERWAGGVDTLDHGVDIVVAADGGWVWKDREHVAEQVAQGRLTETEAAEVWREAGRVAALLDGDRSGRWWESWSDWRPPR